MGHFVDLLCAEQSEKELAQRPSQPILTRDFRIVDGMSRDETKEAVRKISALLEKFS